MIKNRPRSKQFVSVSKMRCLDECDDGTSRRHATTVEFVLSLTESKAFVMLDIHGFPNFRDIFFDA